MVNVYSPATDNITAQVEAKRRPGVLPHRARIQYDEKYLWD